MKHFRVPRDIFFGWGALEYLKSVQGKKAFIVTDKDLHKMGALDKVESNLKEAGLETMVYDGSDPDPCRQCVLNGVELIKKFEPDWIVAVGGGSSIDTAKAIWVMYEYPEMTWEEIFVPFGIPPLRNKAKLIAIATTSGTASEVTCAAVVTNKEVEPNFKEVIASYEITPDVAIADPEMASTMPPSVTSATGMDALTHAIESYTSIAATEIDKALALGAIKMVFRSLPKAYADGRNTVAREDMHTASLMAGMAFTNSFLGIVHALAHQLGTEYRVPHGKANSLMLPYVMQFNRIAVAELYAEIASAVSIEYEDKKDATRKLVQAIFALQKDSGLPSTLQDAGIDEADFKNKVDKLAGNAMNDITVGNNPRVPTLQNMKDLYLAAYYGKEVS